MSVPKGKPTMGTDIFYRTTKFVKCRNTAPCTHQNRPIILQAGHEASPLHNKQAENLCLSGFPLVHFRVEGGARTHDIQNHKLSTNPLFVRAIIFLGATLMQHLHFLVHLLSDFVLSQMSIAGSYDTVYDKSCS